jgi:integrase
MPGARPLTPIEERKLVRLARRLPLRENCLLNAQLWTGYRIAEILRWTVGHVSDASGQVRDKVGLRPAHLKGGYGSTRWIPIGPELRRALAAYLAQRRQSGPLAPEDPLFLSRHHHPDGTGKPICSSSAEKMIRRRLRQIADGDTQRLSTHTLRKSWAKRLYERSGHDLILVRDGLAHSCVSVTQRYLSGDGQKLDACILAGDWTRRPRSAPRRTTAWPLPSRPTTVPPLEEPAADPGWLPGFAPAAA